MIFDDNTYFEQLATENRNIGHIGTSETTHHFYKATSSVNIEGLLQNIPNISGINLVVEDNSDVSSIESKSALIDRTMHSFFLVKRVKINDIDERHTVKNELISVIKQIRSRMWRDYNTDNEGTTDIGLRNIDWNTFSYFTFGPVFDNMIGLHCSFILIESAETTYNDTDWTNIS